MIASFPKPKQQGFAYVEVMIASLLIAVALVPALNAVQTGILATGIHQSLTVQHNQRMQLMETLKAESYDDLLAAANSATNGATPTSYSDASGVTDRRLVFIALYDADADPFTLADPDTDGDNDLYTGSTADLLWLRVETEGAAQGLETVINR